MGLFDLLFIVLFLAAVSTLAAAVWLTVRGRFGGARRILFRTLVAAAVYMAFVIAVSLILPRRVVKADDPQCFDDWCVSIAGFKRAPEGAQVAYRVDLRLFSRARRVAQRENHLAVYLTDRQGRRYDPVADRTSTPFNVLLQPQESVVVSRSFLVPAEAAEVGAVITHEGGFPIGWLIVAMTPGFEGRR